MNKHDEMRQKIATWSREARQEMYQYSQDYEATEKRLKELEKDVQNYFKNHEIDPISDLAIKLSKVGVDNE